jgi:hypothetical protein
MLKKSHVWCNTTFEMLKSNQQLMPLATSNALSRTILLTPADSAYVSAASSPKGCGLQSNARR